MPLPFLSARPARLTPKQRRSITHSASRTSRCSSLSTSSSRKVPEADASSRSSFLDDVNDASALADVARRATAAFFLAPRPADFPPGPAEDVAHAFLSDPLGTLESLEARYGGVVGVLLGGERVVIVGGGGRAGRRAAADVLLDPGQRFAKAGTAFFPGSDVTGNGLLTSDGDSWKRQRALATPAFRKAAVEAYGAAMAREAEETAGRDWKRASETSTSTSTLSTSTSPSSSSTSTSSSSTSASTSPTAPPSPPSPPSSSTSQIRDLYSDFNALTLRVVTAALFGSRLDEGEGRRVARAVDAAFARFAAAGVLGGSGSSGSQLLLELLPEWFPGGGGGASSFKKAVSDLDEVIYDIIASRRRKLEENKGKKSEGKENDGDGGGDGADKNVAPCLLDAMLQARDAETGQSMTDAQLRDELLTMLIAGQETSAAVLSWSAALLAYHPEAQEKVLAEIDSFFSSSSSSSSPSSSRPLAPSDAGKLPLLEAVLLESMRLLPPAYIVGRHAANGAKLSRKGRRRERERENDDGGDGGGPPSSSSSFWKLPPKTSVLVSPYLLHRDSASWEHPRRFLPGRWLPSLLQGGGDDGKSPGTGGSGASGGSGPGGIRSTPLLAGLGPNGSYLPFGAGPRVCVGASFALLEGVLVLAALLRVAELRPLEGGEGEGGGGGGARARFPAAEPRLTLRPSGAGVKLRLIPR